MSAPIMKTCDLHSETFLAWARRQPCFWGDGTCGPTRAPRAFLAQRGLAMPDAAEAA